MPSGQSGSADLANPVVVIAGCQDLFGALVTRPADAEHVHDHRLRTPGPHQRSTPLDGIVRPHARRPPRPRRPLLLNGGDLIRADRLGIPAQATACGPIAQRAAIRVRRDVPNGATLKVSPSSNGGPRTRAAAWRTSPQSAPSSSRDASSAPLITADASSSV